MENKYYNDDIEVDLDEFLELLCEVSTGDERFNNEIILGDIVKGILSISGGYDTKDIPSGIDIKIESDMSIPELIKFFVFEIEKRDYWNSEVE